MGLGTRAAVVGIGHTAQGELPGRSGPELAAEAFAAALADAGLTKSQVDGLVTCRSTFGDGGDVQLGALLGLSPAYSATLDYGSCNFSIHLAAMVIEAGLADTVALTYGTNARTGRADFGRTTGGTADVTGPYGFQHIAGPAAMAFRRHQHLYGTTPEQLGQVAVNQRACASLNPLAVFRSPLSLDDYLAQPYLVEPLRRADLTMISDGAVALIMTAVDRAADLRRPPVRLAGMAQTTALREHADPDHLLRPWLADVADRVYESARCGPGDVDLLYVQDPTSVWVLQALEWFGFCKPGEGGPFLAEGHTRLDGSIPVNTNGGQLSESYMWGWLHVVELVRQLRGAAGPRQVPGAARGLYCSTMEFKKGAASIFELVPS
jgi:acetyl-CoA acetyltransferase